VRLGRGTADKQAEAGLYQRQRGALPSLPQRDSCECAKRLARFLPVIVGCHGAAWLGWGGRASYAAARAAQSKGRQNILSKTI